MRTITITPRAEFRISIEAEVISPDRFAPLSLEQIKNLTIWQGNGKRSCLISLRWRATTL